MATASYKLIFTPTNKCRAIIALVFVGKCANGAVLLGVITLALNNSMHARTVLLVLLDRSALCA
jgi:hypothetical protein